MAGKAGAGMSNLEEIDIQQYHNNCRKCDRTFWTDHPWRDVCGDCMWRLRGAEGCYDWDERMKKELDESWKIKT